MLTFFKKHLAVLFVCALFITCPAQQTSWNISVTSPSSNPSPFPHNNRPCCNETWNLLETARDSFNWAPIDSWITQSQSHGALQWYTLNHVPAWSNGSITAANPKGNLTDPPTDLQLTAQCQGPLASANPTTNCQFKEFITEMMQHVCNSPNQPNEPLVGQCSIRYFEAWNEFNTDNYWTGTYAQLAILVNDYFTIVSEYCGDCVLVAGSVSTSTGYHANGMSGDYDIAEFQFLSALAAIPNAKMPTMLSYHAYASRQDVFPAPFPTTTVSFSDSKCASGTNVYCYVSVQNSMSQFRTAIKSLAFAANLPVSITEGGWGLDDEVCDGANCSVSDLMDPSDLNVIFLRKSYASEWVIVLAASKPAVVMWYAYYNQCWGTMYGSGATQSDCNNAVTFPIIPAGVTETLTAWNQTVAWLNGASVGTATTTPVTGGSSVYILNLTDAHGAPFQLAFFTGWLTNYTMSTSFTQMQDLDGNITATNGKVVLSQAPVKLSGSITLNPASAVTISVH